MRGGHQLAQALQVAGLQRLGRGQRARVLGDDVAGAAEDERIQPGGVLRQPRLVDIAQRRHAVVRGRGLALLAPGVVLAVDQAAAHPRVHDHHRHARGHRHRTALRQMAAVDQQRVAGLAAGGDHLVHDPAVDADEAVLGALRQHRQIDRRQQRIVQAAELAPDLADRHLQRRRGRQSGALRHIAGDRQIRARQLQAVRREVLAKRAHRAAHIVAPLLRRVVRDVAVEVDLVGLAVQVGGDDPQPPVRAPPHRDDGAVVDRAGQHEAVVVVGVLADQVDAAGGLDMEVRPLAEGLEHRVVAAARQGIAESAHGGVHR